MNSLSTPRTCNTYIQISITNCNGSPLHCSLRQSLSASTRSNDDAQISFRPGISEEQRQDIIYAVLENEGKILHDQENEIPANEGLRYVFNGRRGAAGMGQMADVDDSVEFPSDQDEVIPAIKKYEYVENIQESSG